MYYDYIRVSSDKQTVENQKFEITRFAEENGFEIGGGLKRQLAEQKIMIRGSWENS